MSRQTALMMMVSEKVSLLLTMTSLNNHQARAPFCIQIMDLSILRSLRDCTNYQLWALPTTKQYFLNLAQPGLGLQLQLPDEKEYLGHLSMSAARQTWNDYVFQMFTSISKHLLFPKSFYCLKTFTLDRREQFPLSFAHLYKNCQKQYL